MDPAALIPTPDALPVPWGWFQLFLLLTFFFHILLMNVMFGTAFIALANHFRRGVSIPCTETVSASLPFTIAFTVNFGVAPLLFIQVLYGHLIYTSSILMATFWLSIVALLGGAYSLAYVYKYRYARLGGGRFLVAGLITILLMIIAFFFSNNISLMQTPASWSRYFVQPHGLLLNLDDPMFLPRYLHFMVSSVAVGGLAIALSFHGKHKRGDQAAAPWIEYGCRWFSYATLRQFCHRPLVSRHPTQRAAHPVKHHRPAPAPALIGGILLAVPAVMFGLTSRVLPAIYCTLGTIALMILVRSLLRTALLAPWFSVSQLVITPSVSPLFFFLFFFMAGLMLIIWMVRFALRSCAEGEVQS